MRVDAGCALQEATPEMKREAVLTGEYHYSSTTKYPKLQLLSIKQWFDGRKPLLPSDIVNPFKQASMKIGQESLF